MTIQKECQICGSPVSVTPSQLKNGRGKYCSRKCYYVFRKANPPWNKGLKDWQTPEHKEALKRSACQRNKQYPLSSEQARINGSKSTTPSGENHYNWKGGKKTTNYGYVYKLSKDHPRQHNGYVFEHILVMEKHINRFLEPNEVVHHINGIKDDNRLENLYLMLKCEHTSLHHKGK